MPENNKTEEFLQKLAPCIERGELEACVEEAARVAREMGIGAEELLYLSAEQGGSGKHDFAYLLALAAAQGLEGEEKAGAYCNAGIAANYIGKFEESEDYYKKAIQIDSKDADVHYNYANLLEDLGRKIEAEEHYEKEIKLNPKDVDFHNNYALLLVELGKTSEAIQHYKKAIELNPKYIRAHNNYATLLREKAMFSEAEKEVRTALQIYPENPYAFGTYGDILADEDYLEEAIEKYREAIKNSDSMAGPTIAEIHNNLGWAYAHLEKYNRARKEFEEANKLDPQNVKAIRNLRALRKAKRETKFSIIQICLALALLTAIIATWYLFLNKFITENVFAAQSTILIAILIFILLYHQLGKFKAGPIEFEMSTEHRSQPSETIAKIER